MSAKKLIDLIEQQDLVDDKLVAKLRSQISGAKRDISAKQITSLLIEKGHITAVQAKKLLAKVGPEESAPKGKGRIPTKPKKQDRKKEAKVSKSPPPPEEDDLTPIIEEDELEPIEDDLTPVEDDLALVEDDPEDELEDELEPIEDGGLTPIEDGLTPIEETPQKVAAVTPALDPLGGLDELGGDLGGLGSDLGGLDAGGLDAGGLGSGGLGSGGLGALEPVNEEPPEEEPESNAGAHRKKKTRESQWDSPLLYGGGLLFLILLVAGGFLLFNMLRGDASKMFEHAQTLYEEQSYGLAVEAYDKYLDRFPNDPNAGLAKVRRGMALLRMEVENKSDMEDALRVAQEVLPEIQGEERFSEMHPELAGLLPTIAEGFVKQAEATPDSEESKVFIQRAEEAMILANDGAYIPTSQRGAQLGRFDRILEGIATERREIERDEELAKRLVEINAAIEEDNTARAFLIRKELIRNYNDLESNPLLQEAVHRISKKEQDLVTVEAQIIEAVQEDRKTPVISQVLLASQKGDGADGLSGQVVMVPARGAIYGFDAGNGNVLWRRFVGFDSNYIPQRVSDQIGSDAILVDSMLNEVVRVQALTGDVVWRATIGEPMTEPVVTPDKIFVSTPSGKVYTLSTDTGDVSRHAQLPMPAPMGAGISETRPQIYQVGEHSNLYVLSKQDLRCREVFYVGHKAGTVKVPPLVQKGFVFVCENAGTDYSLLHILTTNSNGLELTAVQDPIRMQGHIVRPPMVYNRSVLTVTNLGAAYLCEVDASRTVEPVRVTVESKPRYKAPELSYPLATSRRLWMADKQLTSYQFLVAQGALSEQQINFQEETFVAPLQSIGDIVFHVRRGYNSSAYSVAASRDATGDPLWETHIATPFAGSPLLHLEKGVIVATNAEGRMFEVASDLPNGFEAKSVPIPKGISYDGDYGYSAKINPNLFAFANRNRGDLALVYEAGSGIERVRKRKLSAPREPPSTPPVGFGGGLLSASSAGTVFLCNVEEDGNLAQPFQPPLSPGVKVAWLPPIPLDADTFAIANEAGKLYRIVHQPGVALKKTHEASLEGLANRIALVGDTVIAIRREGGTDAIVTFASTDLKPGEPVALNARCEYGPFAVGNVAIMRLANGEMLAIDSAGKEVWRRQSEHSLPVGEPLILGTGVVLVSPAGQLWKVSLDSGEESPAIDIGQPLASGAQKHPKGLLLTGTDGVMHLVSPNANP